MKYFIYVKRMEYFILFKWNIFSLGLKQRFIYIFRTAKLQICILCAPSKLYFVHWHLIIIWKKWYTPPLASPMVRFPIQHEKGKSHV